MVSPVWKMDEVHVVPSGKVQATNTEAEVDAATYAKLWEQNAYDYLLFAYAQRLFLERLNCPDDDALFGTAGAVPAAAQV